MKTILKKLPMVAALCGIILLPGCAETAADQTERTNEELQAIADDAREMDADNVAEWTLERNAILADLRGLRDDIATELNVRQAKLAKKDLKADERARHESLKAELVREKNLLDETIANMEGIDPNATMAERTTASTKAERTRTDVKTWWEKRKEEQDKHTEADYDNDGH